MHAPLELSVTSIDHIAQYTLHIHVLSRVTWVLHPLLVTWTLPRALLQTISPALLASNHDSGDRDRGIRHDDLSVEATCALQM